jgi:secreted trypsin-like serine protease
VGYKADEGNFTGAEDINKETLDENTTQLPTFDDDEVVGRIVNGHEVRRGEYPWTVQFIHIQITFFYAYIYIGPV